MFKKKENYNILIKFIYLLLLKIGGCLIILCFIWMRFLRERATGPVSTEYTNFKFYFYIFLIFFFY